MTARGSRPAARARNTSPARGPRSAAAGRDRQSNITPIAPLSPPFPFHAPPPTPCPPLPKNKDG